MTVQAGFMGSLSITTSAGTSAFGFTDATFNSTYNINTPDVVDGSWDRLSWAYGTSEWSGSFSGIGAPKGLWAWANGRACSGASKALITLYTGCSGDMSVDYVYPQSMSLSCTAGDIVNWSLEAMGYGASSSVTSPSGAISNSGEMANWKSIGVTGGPSGEMQSVEVSVNNNYQMVFYISSGTTGGGGTAIPGKRSYAGSISSYGTSGMSSGNVSIKFDTLTCTVSGAKVNSISHTVNSGPVMTSHAFVGTGAQ